MISIINVLEFMMTDAYNLVSTSQDCQALVDMRRHGADEIPKHAFLGALY